MKDYLLEKLFETERWQYAIDKGLVKGMSIKRMKDLCKPEVRAMLYFKIKNDEYLISPPHTALIPKPTEPGKFRTVYINEEIDRIILSIANDMFFELFPEMVHKSCKSYQKGCGCSKVVEECVSVIKHIERKDVGFKADLSKYFDSVPIQFIDGIFDRMDEKFGKSKLISVIRAYYHQDVYFDCETKEYTSKFQSLKQGCAVASFLADAVLYNLDVKMSAIGPYWRYSDDILCLGDNYGEQMEILTEELSKMDMKLNPKKVEYLSKDRWFGFLGFTILGEKISLRIDRIRKFQREVEHRTIKSKNTKLSSCVEKLNRWLWKGDGRFSWATACISTINCEKDILELDKFIFDCLRAVVTGKHRVGGLGYVDNKTDGCISRGIGRNVKSNREKVTEKFDGILSVGCMRKAKLSSRDFYDTLVRTL